MGHDVLLQRVAERACNPQTFDYNYNYCHILNKENYVENPLVKRRTPLAQTADPTVQALGTHRRDLKITKIGQN